MTRPTVVLHAIPDLDVGGAERMLVEVLPNLREAGFDLHVCCLKRRGQLADVLESRGIPVHVLGLRRTLDLHRIGRLWRLLRSLRVDILHAHLFVTEALTVPVAHMLRRPIVIATKHNEGRWMRPHHLALERWLAQQTDAFTATSEAVLRAAVGRGLPRDRIEVVYPSAVRPGPVRDAADREAIRASMGIPPGASVLGVVGRLHPVKGHRILLEAAAALRSEFPDLFLLLAGRGSLEERIRAQARDLGLADRLRIDFDPEGIGRFLEAMDVFVMPSDSEGFPLSLLEAMCMGKPIVASAVGGIPEAVEDGRSGVLVPPGQPDRLGQAIAGFLRDPPRAQAMGGNAAARVLARFTADRTAAAFEQIYVRLLRHRE